MTIYEKMCADKVYCASMISGALHSGQYEDTDYDPYVMEVLNREYEEAQEQEGDG